MVHLVDENDAGDAGFFCISPHPLGNCFNAVLRIDEDDGGFNREQGGLGFVGEHVEAGGVDEIDFDALPLGKGDGVLHGDAAGYFFFVIGGNSGAVFNPALGWGHLGGMQQSGDQSGFAAVRMPDYSYITDLTSLVRFHGFLLEFSCVVLKLEWDLWLGLERDRDCRRTSLEASRWPDLRATAPGVPSTSSIDEGLGPAQGR